MENSLKLLFDPDVSRQEPQPFDMALPGGAL